MAYTSFTAGQVVTAAQLNTIPHVVYATTTAVQDVNTTLSTVSVLDASTPYTIPAGLLGTNGTLHGVLEGDYLNNTAGASNLTIRLVLGGSTAWQSSARSMTNGATRVPIWIEFRISNTNATNLNKLSGWWAGNSGPGTAGIASGYERVESIYSFSQPNCNVDTTVAQTLDILVTHGTSSASISFRRHKVTFTHIPTA